MSKEFNIKIVCDDVLNDTSIKVSKYQMNEYRDFLNRNKDKTFVMSFKKIQERKSTLLSKYFLLCEAIGFYLNSHTQDKNILKEDTHQALKAIYAETILKQTVKEKKVFGKTIGYDYDFSIAFDKLDETGMQEYYNWICKYIADSFDIDRNLNADDVLISEYRNII